MSFQTSFPPPNTLNPPSNVVPVIAGSRTPGLPQIPWTHAQPVVNNLRRSREAMSALLSDMGILHYVPGDNSPRHEPLVFGEVERKELKRKIRAVVRNPQRISALGFEILGRDGLPVGRSSAAAGADNIEEEIDNTTELESNSSVGDDENHGTTQTFHRFPCFPPEIRQNIWEQSLPRRVILITSDDITVPNHLNPEDDPDRPITIPRARATSYLPPIFRTCHESRQIALRAYTPSLSSYLDSRPILLNFSLDQLRFTSHTALLSFLGLSYREYYAGEVDFLAYDPSIAYKRRADLLELGQLVQHVALEDTGFVCTHELQVWYLLSHFRALRSLVVCEDVDRGGPRGREGRVMKKVFLGMWAKICERGLGLRARWPEVLEVEGFEEINYLDCGV